VKRLALLLFVVIAALEISACGGGGGGGGAGGGGGGGYVPPPPTAPPIELVAVRDQYPFVAVGFSSPYPSLATPLPINGSPDNYETASMTHDASGTLFVAELPYPSGSGPGEVAIYTPPYTGMPSVVTNGINVPIWVGVDNHDNLLVANCPSGCSTATITIYAPPYTAAPTTTIAIVSSSGLVIGPNGELFAAESSGTSVALYTPPYSGAPQIISVPGHFGFAYPIAVDGSGNLFVANCQWACQCPPVCGNDFITEYSPPTYNLVATITQGLNLIVNLSVGSSGQLFAEQYSGNTANVDTVNAYFPPYTAAPTVISNCNNINPIGGPAAIDSTGNLFITCYGFGIQVYAPPYTGAPQDVLAGAFNPILPLQSTPASLQEHGRRAHARMLKLRP